MICSLCLARPCEDSIGSRQGLCQDCWESACSESWWDAVTDIPRLQDLALITEHDLPEVRDPNPKDQASAHTVAPLDDWPTA